MSTIDDEQMQTRQKLEFLLGDENLAYKPPIAPPPVANNHSWSSFYAGAGASLLLLAGGVFGGYLYHQANSDRASAVPTPKSFAIPAQIPVVVSIPPHMIDPASIKTLHPNGLSAARSVITGVADPDSLSASYYWTFSLHNSTSANKEAQMRMVLPAGAVVSRATLWINGKPQEAAFNSTDNVTRAYNWVVNGRRDPLLITQISANQVMIKASPVMPRQDMKLRIGMTVPMKLTADNQAELTLPYINDSNVNISCKQSVHITAPSTMYSNHVSVQNESNKTGSLLRGNIDATSLEKLTVSMARSVDLTRFATRATHSDPPGFIVATVERNPQTNVSSMTLSKTLENPNCPAFSSEHTAYRLSYMWAKQEIDRLVQENQRGQAVELASVYRVVSPVSGAVVLERSSDYDQMGLDRSMGRTLSYTERRSMTRPEGAGPVPQEDASRAPSSPMPSAKAEPSRRLSMSASPAPENKRASYADLEQDKSAPRESQMLDEAPIQVPNYIISNPAHEEKALNWTLMPNIAPAKTPTLTMLILAILNFAGPLAFLTIAACQIFRFGRTAKQTAAIGAVWLVCALYSPILSQTAAILVAIIWTVMRLCKMLDLSKTSTQ